MRLISTHMQPDIEETGVDQDSGGRMRQITPRGPRRPRQADFAREDADSSDSQNIKRKSLFAAATSGITIFFISLTVAILGDIAGIALEIIPGVGGFIASITVTPIASFFIYVINKSAGHNFSSKTKMIMGACLIIEFIPILNALPALTAAVVTSKIAEVSEQVMPLRPDADQ